MSPKLPRIAAAELLRALKRDGWYEHHQVGSHLHLKHPTKAGRVVLPIHAGKLVKPGTLTGVLADAGLSIDRLRDLL